ncbi:MAG: hypothetical protein A2X05_16820 [Bacteroidetes bacterium GWE2_41_25]|nr:MAG: hypothetical protein A2X03_03255 [Bacteroidetes bacterium GWA2_40_15]OFY01662.1 MAG: hypothetical protein A2X06_06185 [Bacteroidetes bacterium GWC2_40_22]OFY07206.1 MAG: hypothetical protein A2X05_16820 [Bacteroidetes bacterium GWE2_41_25]OFY57222.1 MAG: hypothetical protein A2X04_16465 [Bacteroidetes bacterium GWF2_41_9]HAM09951.1 nuclear pore complex subunit [Bacteroidales bacterium]
MNEINHIFTERTSKTPQVDFNHHSGDLILSGRSIPENAAKIYEPLLLWINEYVKSPRKVTNFRLNLEYFNSASTIWIAKLVKALGKIEDPESVLYIHLYFDIEDLTEMNEEDVKHSIGSLIDNIGEIKISIGIKIYGTDKDGTVIKESTILI